MGGQWFGGRQLVAPADRLAASSAPAPGRAKRTAPVAARTSNPLNREHLRRRGIRRRFRARPTRTRTARPRVEGRPAAGLRPRDLQTAPRGGMRHQPAQTPPRRGHPLRPTSPCATKPPSTSPRSTNGSDRLRHRPWRGHGGRHPRSTIGADDRSLAHRAWTHTSRVATTDLAPCPHLSPRSVRAPPATHAAGPTSPDPSRDRDGRRSTGSSPIPAITPVKPPDQRILNCATESHTRASDSSLLPACAGSSDVAPSPPPCRSVPAHDRTRSARAVNIGTSAVRSNVSPVLPSRRA